eukprot:5827029-Pleurochrysis_carterae.AAC.1
MTSSAAIGSFCLSRPGVATESRLLAGGVTVNVCRGIRSQALATFLASSRLCCILGVTLAAVHLSTRSTG